MDGRTSAFTLFGLALLVCGAAGGCVTTQEKQVTVRNQSEPSTLTDPHKDKAQKPIPPPPRVLLAFAQMKEKEAESEVNKDKLEEQASLRDQARQAYQNLLKAEPNNVEAFRGLGRIYVRMGDYERAQDIYKKGLVKLPRNVDLWYDLGMMHDRRKEWAEGVGCFRKGLESDPENQRCLKALGFTLARVGQLDESVKCLTQAMGSAAAAHYNVAMMLLHVSEQEQLAQRTSLVLQARQHLRRALEQDPAYERARETLASLDGQPGGASQGAVQIQFAAPASEQPVSAPLPRPF